MAQTRERRGGLKGVDPAVMAWQAGAARNEAALSTKQRYDRVRVRVRLDVPEAVATGLARAAATWETSQTQLGAFLLAWGLGQLQAGDGPLTEALQANRQWSKAINVKHDLLIPEGVLGDA